MIKVLPMGTELASPENGRENSINQYFSERRSEISANSSTEHVNPIRKKDNEGCITIYDQSSQESSKLDASLSPLPYPLDLDQ